MAGRPELRGVENDEQVVGVRVDLGNVIALAAVLDSEQMAAEDVHQDCGGLLVPRGEVHPDEPVLAGNQDGQVRNGMPLDASRGNPVHLHHAAARGVRY